jgi:dTDP-4-dehydrorhamnose reductase
MRCAVIGSTGLFGQDLMAYLSGHDLVAHGFHRGNFIIGISPAQIAEQLLGFDTWVNCVGFTQVDRAESLKEEANLINGLYAGILAQGAKLAGARFIQISTDYVFDGIADAPYKVGDSTNPKTEYGKSKALGEQLVEESGADYSILRTAWLYGANGRCFPKVMAETLKKKRSVKVVDDQIGQPTWTRDLAGMVLQVLQLRDMPRVVHATASGKTSWAGFAKEIAQSIGMSASSVEEISSAEFPTAANRPAWSVLDNSSDVIKPIGDWRERWHVAAPEVLKGI